MCKYDDNSPYIYIDLGTLPESHLSMESPTFQSGILPLITRGKIRIDKSRINVNLEFLGIERDLEISGTRQDAYNRPLVCHAGPEILEYSSLLTNIQWAKGYGWFEYREENLFFSSICSKSENPHHTRKKPE